MTQLLKQYDLITCPICEKELIEQKIGLNYSKQCTRECFIYLHNKEYDESIFIIGVFGSYCSWNKYNDETQSTIKEKIDQQINYWKENDRYILKWMKVE